MTYAFSKLALDEYRGWLTGNRWHAADNVLFELPRQRATRAIIELAVMFRALDDAREITKGDYVATHPYVVYHDTGFIYGRVIDEQPKPLPFPDDKEVTRLESIEWSKPLALSDVPNKVIHAKSIEWDLSNPKEPLIICHAAEADYAQFKWTRAEVFVKPFAAVCAALASPRQ